jgi:glycine cleavage system H protein
MSIKYTPDHEWLKVDGDIATVGITHHAQDALGDVVFVDLPEVGKTLRRQRSGRRRGIGQGRRRRLHARQWRVTEVNEALRADPSLANTDPLGAGWFFKVKLSNAAELDGLMDETSYTRSLQATELAPTLRRCGQSLPPLGS